MELRAKFWITIVASATLFNHTTKTQPSPPQKTVTGGAQQPTTQSIAQYATPKYSVQQPTTTSFLQYTTTPSITQQTTTTSSAQLTTTTSSAQQTRTTSSAQHTRTTSSPQQTRTTSSAQRATTTSSAPQTTTTSSAQQTTPTSSEHQTSTTSSAQHTTPTSSEQQTTPMRSTQQTTTLSRLTTQYIELGTNASKESSGENLGDYYGKCSCKEGLCIHWHAVVQIITLVPGLIVVAIFSGILIERKVRNRQQVEQSRPDMC